MQGGMQAGPDAGSPRARRDLVLQEIGDEGLLYDREGALVHVLNLTALHAWRLCDGAHDVDQIAAGLERAFSGTAGMDIRRDVETLLARFAERGLLEKA